MLSVYLISQCQSDNLNNSIKKIIDNFCLIRIFSIWRTIIVYVSMLRLLKVGGSSRSLTCRERGEEASLSGPFYENDHLREGRAKRNKN